MDNTYSRELRKSAYQECFYLLFLVVAMAMIPKEITYAERIQFILFLCIPIVLSIKHFVLSSTKIKISMMYISLFILVNYFTFLLHVWQLRWEVNNQEGLFGWQLHIDQWMHSIPFNDGMWLRQFASPMINEWVVPLYIHGFVLCLFALAIYYLFTGQPKKILVALLAGHFLQYLLLLPFHFWVDGHQVWYVQNAWDGTTFIDPIKGYRTLTEPIIPSLNHVFPSMHCSIATVVILLTLREKSKPLRYFLISLNILIVLSTVYLGIHWVIDVFGGIFFGYLVLKLADKLVSFSWFAKKVQRAGKGTMNKKSYTQNI